MPRRQDIEEELQKVLDAQEELLTKDSNTYDQYKIRKDALAKAKDKLLEYCLSNMKNFID